MNQSYLKMSKDELKLQYEKVLAEYNDIKAKGSFPVYAFMYKNLVFILIISLNLIIVKRIFKNFKFVTKAWRTFFYVH